MQRRCAVQVPQRLRGEIRVECDITARHLTICDCRPRWVDDLGPEWTRFPIARVQHTKTTGLRTLYWRDRNLTFHRYPPLEPSPRLQELLDYLDTRADPIFWGQPAPHTAPGGATPPVATVGGRCRRPAMAGST